MVYIILASCAIFLLIILIVLMLVSLSRTKKSKNDISFNDLNHVEKTLKDEISNLKNEMENKLSNVQRNVNDGVNYYFNNFSTLTNEKLGYLTIGVKENLKEVSP